MSENTLFCKRFRAMKWQGEGRYQRTPASNHDDAVEEHRAMAADSQYTDSESGFNKNKCEQWQPIGEVAARLVKAVRK